MIIGPSTALVYAVDVNVYHRLVIILGKLPEISSGVHLAGQVEGLVIVAI
jgi:hypothetical protein